jgi:hypothetical protein
MNEPGKVVAKRKQKKKRRSRTPGPALEVTLPPWFEPFDGGVSDAAIHRRKNIKNFDIDVSSMADGLWHETIFDGFAGDETSRLLQITKITMTTSTIEIERYGANALMTILTLGVWFFYCKTERLDTYAIEDFKAIEYTTNGVIKCMLDAPSTWQNYIPCFPDPRVLMLDIREQDGFGTKELFEKLKDAFDRIQHGLGRSSPDLWEIDGIEMMDVSVETDGLLMDDEGAP